MAMSSQKVQAQIYSARVQAVATAIETAIAEYKQRGPQDSTPKEVAPFIKYAKKESLFDRLLDEHKNQIAELEYKFIKISATPIKQKPSRAYVSNSEHGSTTEPKIEDSKTTNSNLTDSKATILEDSNATDLEIMWHALPCEHRIFSILQTAAETASRASKEMQPQIPVVNDINSFLESMLQQKQSLARLSLCLAPYLKLKREEIITKFVDFTRGLSILEGAQENLEEKKSTSDQPIQPAATFPDPANSADKIKQRIISMLEIFRSQSANLTLENDLAEYDVRLSLIRNSLRAKDLKLHFDDADVSTLQKFVQTFRASLRQATELAISFDAMEGAEGACRKLEALASAFFNFSSEGRKTSTPNDGVETLADSKSSNEFPVSANPNSGIKTNTENSIALTEIKHDHALAPVQTAIPIPPQLPPVQAITSPPPQQPSQIKWPLVQSRSSASSNLNNTNNSSLWSSLKSWIWEQLTEHPIRTALLITLPILAAFFPPLVGLIAWKTAPAWLPPLISAVSVFAASFAGILLHNNVFGRFLEKTFKQLEAPFKINNERGTLLSILVLHLGALGLIFGMFVLPPLLPAALIATTLTSTFLPLACTFAAMLVTTFMNRHCWILYGSAANSKQNAGVG